MRAAGSRGCRSVSVTAVDSLTVITSSNSKHLSRSRYPPASLSLPVVSPDTYPEQGDSEVLDICARSSGKIIVPSVMEGFE